MSMELNQGEHDDLKRLVSVAYDQSHPCQLHTNTAVSLSCLSALLGMSLQTRVHVRTADNHHKRLVGFSVVMYSCVCVCVCMLQLLTELTVLVQHVRQHMRRFLPELLAMISLHWKINKETSTEQYVRPECLALLKDLAIYLRDDIRQVGYMDVALLSPCSHKNGLMTARDQHKNRDIRERVCVCVSVRVCLQYVPEWLPRFVALIVDAERTNVSIGCPEHSTLGKLGTGFFSRFRTWSS